MKKQKCKQGENKLYNRGQPVRDCNLEEITYYYYYYLKIFAKLYYEEDLVLSTVEESFNVKMIPEYCVSLVWME